MVVPMGIFRVVFSLLIVAVAIFAVVQAVTNGFPEAG